MRKTTTTLALSAGLAAAVGLSIGALVIPPTNLGLSQPTQAPASVTTCAEDEPCWDCSTMGNKVCGNLTESQRAAAWDAWDAINGWSKMRSACTPEQVSKVDVSGYSAAASPTAVPAGQLTLPATDGSWYLFTERCI